MGGSYKSLLGFQLSFFGICLHSIRMRLLTNDIDRQINCISLLIVRITRLMTRITRLINGWRARPDPGAAAPPPNPPPRLVAASGLGRAPSH